MIEHPVRRRGREPPRPAAASSSGQQHSGWQLHYSSNGHPFYFNRSTGESVWAVVSNETAAASSSPGASGWDGEADTCPRDGGEMSDMHSHASTSRGRSSSSSWGSESITTPGSASTRDRNSSTGTSSEGDSLLSTSSSASSRTSSDSWTASMEGRFRRFALSSDGRRQLSEEVRQLMLSASRSQQRRVKRRDHASMARLMSTEAGEHERDEDDMEAALLPGTDGDSHDNDNNNGTSSNNSSGSSTDSSRTSSSSTFSLRLDSGGESDLSLLDDDLVLKRLQRVEKVVTLAGSAVHFALTLSLGEIRSYA